MTASGSVSIKSINLTNIGSDRLKPGRTRNHFCGHPLFSIVYPTWNAAKEAWVIVRSRTEDISMHVQTDSPSIIVILMKKLHL